MFQGRGWLRQGTDKEFLSSEKSKKIIGVFMETDYRPIMLKICLDLRSYSLWPLFLAHLGPFCNLFFFFFFFRNLEPWGRPWYWEMQCSILIVLVQMGAWGLLLSSTVLSVVSFLRERGLLAAHVNAPCSESLFALSPWGKCSPWIVLGNYVLYNHRIVQAGWDH